MWPPPLELKDGWNLERGDLFWGLVSLVRARKIRFLWWAPPCTSFSLARTPKLRNLENAFGFNLLDEATLMGNLHAMQSLFLAMLQVLGTTCFWIHEGSVYLENPGRLDWCRYARDFHKTTRIMSNCLGLKKLAKRCCHARKHVVLKGAATTLAGAYTPEFCRRVAELWGSFWEEHLKNAPNENGSDFSEPLTF